ncbi:hypothetical protein CLV91_1593 [Maribacter vaceletii]|uniref:Sulfite dehydrogenase (Cytochrome) subunit SorB n=1 Tax=Maribacter vaceletii TaxID=1206816 RepID=A0A495E8A3_9FLAO|nr:monoheme cytochrome C [Maribacter vaceletii]RKR12881.1 hypothetical protein CLV91_1593 [Maribacter vaceletii]
MKNSDFRIQVKAFYAFLLVCISLLVLLSIVILLYNSNPDIFYSKKEIDTKDYIEVSKDDNYDKIENGIHIRTGFKEGEGLMETVNNCTNCHSAQLVIQNRMNKERWEETIHWMQETQNLWDLGDNEAIIINYLVTNYPPVKKGRRTILSTVEWYNLEDE